MGWNYGGAVIDFDFRTVGEAPAAGTLALEHFPWSVKPADAPISFEEASSYNFDGCAYGPVGGKTLLLSRDIGISQESLVEEGKALSIKRGRTLIFWINDASGSYMFSVFENGERVRFFSSGPGLNDDEGEAMEEEGDRHPYDRIKAIMKSMIGDVDLFEVPFERFDSV